MTLQTHTIRQQYLHIEWQGNEAQGKDLQQSLAQYCQTWLTPVLEQVLTKYAPVDSHWLIERLEINVGHLPLHRWQQDLPHLLAQALEKTLQDQCPSKTDTITAINSSNIKQQSTQQHLNEALIYFLRTGTLPWNLQLPAGKNFEQTLLNSWQESSANHHTDLIAAFTSRIVRTRLVQQFSVTFLTLLLKRITPAVNNRMNSIWQRLQDSQLPNDVRLAFTQQLWDSAFAQIASKQHNTDSQIVRDSWQQLPPTMQQPVLLNLLAQHWQDVTAEISAVIKNETIAFEQTTEHDKSLDNKQKQYFDNHENADTTKDINTLPFSKNQPTNSTVSNRATRFIDINHRFSSDDSLSQHLDIKEGIYINNAGLVLLHPFLPQFFQALNIADEDQLIQPERALSLLHFLMTGQLNAPEYELVLPKLLCNIPLETPVPANVSLTNSEIEEAVALLNAVIHHWAVLKNTGIDGLRGTFLLRAGKLTLLNDGDWRLQIEHQSFDILLDQLPWGIGMIKLPWMPRMLWVEWN